MLDTDCISLGKYIAGIIGVFKRSRYLDSGLQNIDNKLNIKLV